MYNAPKVKDMIKGGFIQGLHKSTMPVSLKVSTEGRGWPMRLKQGIENPMSEDSDKYVTLEVRMPEGWKFYTSRTGRDDFTIEHVMFLLNKFYADVIRDMGTVIWDEEGIPV